MSKHPINAAKAIANILDSDPVMAGQIKEHLSTDRILDLLDLDADELLWYTSKHAQPVEE